LYAPIPLGFMRDTAVKARLDESEQNVGMLKSGIMQLLRFLEGKKA